MSFASLRAARQSKESKSFVDGARPIRGSTVLTNSQNETAQPDPDKEPMTPEVVADQPSGLPAWLDVRRSTARGKGLYAKETLTPGSIVLSLRPRVSVLSTPNLEFYCSYCAGPALDTSLRRCTGCRIVRYCDSSCQNSDWYIHKSECQALQRWASSAPSADVGVPSDAVRCLGRTLWTMQKKGLDSYVTKELSLLQSHRGSLPPSSHGSHTLLAHSIVRYIGATSPSELAPYGLVSAGDLVDLISRFTTNTFTLTSCSLTPIGICTSPPLALVNHSCDPNSVVVFPRPSKSTAPEPVMQLVSLRPINVDEEILIAYIDTTLPRELRRATLEESYNFVCKCTLCDGDISDPRVSMRCPKACGGTCPLPTEEENLTRCVKCRAVVSSVDSVLDAVRVGQEALSKATALQFRDPVKASQLTTNMIPILSSAGLTPSCHPLLAMTRLHKELLITSLGTSFSQDILDDTIRAAVKYNIGLSNVLTYGHPVRSVALAEAGKLLAVDEPSPPNAVNVAEAFPPHGPPRLRLAHEMLVQARSELAIGFGRANEGGQLGLELREIIVRTEKELGVWDSGVRNVVEDAKSAKATQRRLGTT
ncbi:hypothetical protein PHLGIDRAFT_73889 [Phlebiopsis gigantea 11061_1 CR5-6]|uniref:MYND-type domain-containing protein n=1 Tax=Phlebiopsis gigantea (strain 11061_1 CR5-6) TaxID=745531 RepID=A0A0C3S5J8_PHLG1|nr:hypothetical protein PHLGIDRAFT_73889 [Phlebiopsis gigantea 11061_1 CR5-6]